MFGVHAHIHTNTHVTKFLVADCKRILEGYIVVEVETIFSARVKENSAEKLQCFLACLFDMSYAMNVNLTA